MPPLVLVVEDETILGDSIAVYLERHGYATSLARSGEEALRLVDEAGPDVAVVDVRLPGMDGVELLRRVRECSPATEVIMMTAHGSVASAVEAMKLGAFDYLTKPLDLDELRVVVGKALEHLRLRRELSYFKAREEQAGRLAEIIGESPPMQELKRQIARIAALEPPGGGDAPTILVLGETGVGKEIAARAIHALSPRASGPFVEINCAAIPASLLEAELFGYEKGAYTDARSAKPGLFEAADGGTLFLDEIGHVEPAIQVKLLKAIEEKSVRRLGSLRSKTFNIRVIAATNRDLEAAVAEGAFRADLYYRVKALTIVIPPLRERRGDIPVLAHHFLERSTRRYGLPQKALSPEAVEALSAYTWPGNVRELAHVMERAALLHGEAAVRPEHLGLPAGRERAPVTVRPGGGVEVNFSAGGIVLDDVERQLIAEALRATGWNRTRAAQFLGITKETLRYRIERHDLRPPA